MATVKLACHETRARALPRVCAFCGKPAEVYQARTFSRSPPATALLFFLGHGGHLAHLLLHSLLTRRATVWLPVCRAHLRQQRPGDLRLTPSLVLTLLGAGLAIVLAVAAAGMALDAGGAWVWVAACILGAGLVLAAVIAVVGAVVAVRDHLNLSGEPRISATEITDGGTTLAGVADEFARAVERQRMDRGDDPIRPRDQQEQG